MEVVEVDTEVVVLVQVQMHRLVLTQEALV